MSKILVGISGGLDSAAALYELVSAGHTVEAAILDMHGHTEVDEARKIADIYGVKLHVVDCRDDFDRYVKDYFVEEYSRGRTPNPCIVCNRYVKMASLISHAEKLGFDYAATGHYVKRGYDGERYFIERGVDEKKDQSYVLWMLTQQQIEKLVFPLGDKRKSDVRERARTLGLEVADRPESQEICFIPDDDYVSYIESRVGVFPRGNFVDLYGNKIGEHKGIIHYTIGQRKGLGMSFGEHMFVKRIDAESNEITLCRSGEEYSSSLEVSGLNFVGLAPCDNATLELDVKLRYAAPPIPARMHINGDKAFVELPVSARAVTPGQSAVFYSGKRVMLGGVITKADL